MSVGAITPITRWQILDNGVPAAGAKLYTYLSGTSTPKPVYSSSTVDPSTARTNPVVADAEGVLPICYLDAVSYRFLVTDSAGATIFPAQDNVYDFAQVQFAASGGSALIGFVQAGSGAVQRTAQAKMRERLSVADFGATGDGVTDDTAAINLAIAAADALGGAWIDFHAGTFIVTPDGSSYCINISADNIHLRGAGRGATIIKLADGQGSFSRPIGATGRTDISIQSLTVDGNKANQTAGFEQQHGIFLSGCTHALVSDVHVKNTRGDNVYWHGGCVRCTFEDCWLEGTDRVGIHAQAFTDCSIANCHIWDMDSGQGGIKSELDNEGVTGTGLTVTGCTIEATTVGGIFGILMSGFSATTVMENLAVTGNTFRNLAQAVGLGIYSRGWSVSGNVIDGCTSGIVEGSYSTLYGYTAQQDIAIVGNDLRAILGTGADEWAISVSNCTRITIAGNNINGSTGSNGIRIQHSADAVITGNSITLNGTNASVISFYRAITAQVAGNFAYLTAGGTSYGVLAQDDLTYPTTLISVSNLTIRGTITFAVKNSLVTAASLAVSLVTSPGAGTLIDTTDALTAFPELARFTFGTKKWTFGTAAPASGTWATGDVTINTAGTAGGFAGWYCTAGGTPGTWKTFAPISA